MSQLCYIRNIFPEDAFGESDFGDIRIRAIKRGRSPEADRLLQWIEDGVFPLLQKGTLRMVVLGIFTDPAKSNEFVEAWYFRYIPGARFNPFLLF